MDLVVNRLSEIESAAVRILNEADIQNKELDEISAKHIEEYDAKIDSETEQKLQALNKELEQQMESELARLRQDTDKVIRTIDADYKANHEKLADKILQKLIEE